MTIGIDIRVLARGTLSGIEEYTLNLLSYLLPLDKNINYKLFYNAYRKVDLEFKWLTLLNVKLINSNIPNRLFDITSRFLNFPKVDKLLGGVDVFFSPHIFLAALSKNCPCVVTFHDLSFEHYKEFYSAQKHYWHFSMNPRFQAKRAAKIIAVSESTKRDLIEIYKIPEEKIKVVYSGTIKQNQKLVPSPSTLLRINSIEGSKIILRQAQDDSRKETQGNSVMVSLSNHDTEWSRRVKNQKLVPSLSRDDKSKLKNIRKKYNLPEKFILYLGTIEPRKNIIGLIKAFEIFKKSFRFQVSGFKLIIAGAKGWLYRDVFKSAIGSPYRDDIIFTGFIDDNDKEYIYRMASLFVYPSFYEGFGFPPLEAMIWGVPAITSNASSLPEAVGNAALMVDPYNINEMAWAMKELLTDSNLRQLMIKRGFEQIKKFSWQKCARETLEVLKTTK